MRYDPSTVELFQSTHSLVLSRIEERLGEFRSIWDQCDEESALRELLFCILTPQSKARLCWEAIEEMACTDILLNGTYDEILEAVGKVRFKYRKTRFLMEARDRFHREGDTNLLSFIREFDDAPEAREWLVKNIKGLGYKEASHFLRNIGLGGDLGILDRHILRSLNKAGVIEGIPGSLGNKGYLEIEERMREFSGNINIPLSHLDLVLWHVATGDIFK